MTDDFDAVGAFYVLTKLSDRPTTANFLEHLQFLTARQMITSTYDFLRYNVRGYPTLMLMKDGKRLVDYRGPRDLEHLRDFLRTNERALERVQAAEH